MSQDEDLEDQDGSVDGSEASDNSDDDSALAAKPRAYDTLLQTFQRSSHADGPQRKRRRIQNEEEDHVQSDGQDTHEDLEDAMEADADDAELSEQDAEEEDEDEDEGDDDDDDGDDQPLADGDDAPEVHQDDDDDSDPYALHFAFADDSDFQKRIKSVAGQQWRPEKLKTADDATITFSLPSAAEQSALRNPIKSISQLKLKKRLAESAESRIAELNPVEQAIAPYLFDYQDLLCGARTVRNAASLRRLASLHAINHIYKGRDRVLKNSQRLSQASNPDDLELRDQGFTRPKVLILLETRQACSKYVDTIMDLCQPEQQENRKRFQDQFVGDEDKFKSDTMPEDYRELFEGNDDNDFRLGIKFTRKTVKYFSQFYSSDIIFASPLGLRRIMENADPKKADHDFLSSIEVCIVDQADAMLMQNWEHVEFVFSHLNLQPKDAHGCDFSRVRHWYLDNNAKHLRQTIVFSGFVTPELNRLFNSSMLNVSGKAKYMTSYKGAIMDIGMSIKQTFSRFESTSPVNEPDDRFKYFTSAIVPSLSKLPKLAEGGQGVVLFVPSYLDFVRVRNYFATSNATQHLSFGAISEYTSVSDSRRARSHFLTGRHSVLLYTGRAHHFHRYRIKGVRRVIMYAVPDNPIHYQELVAGFLGTTIAEGKAEEGDVSARAVFSRFDALRLERIVGTKRIGNMLRDKGGDTFDFV